MAGSSPLHGFIGEMLVNAGYTVIKCCLLLDAECRNPPIATTSLLYSLGYSQYRVRRFWDKLSSLGKLTYEIYKYRDFIFNLSIVHEEGALKEVECNDYVVPLDDYDALRIGHYYTPHAHKLYAFIEGGFEDVEFKLNILKMLVPIARDSPTIVDEARDILVEMAWGRGDIRGLGEIIIKLIDSGRRFIEFATPKTPRNLDELARLSPVYRRLYNSIIR